MAATWDLRKLQQYLEKYEIGPLYLVYGEEQFLVDESLALIKSKVLQEGATDFNSDQFYVGDTPAANVRDAVETLPVMCDRRLVVLKGIQALKEKDWEQLLPVIEKPIETTTFVLVGSKIDKRKKYVKKVQQKGVLVELNRPYDNQVPVWIEYISYQCELKLSGKSMALVHQLVGNNLTEIKNELNKLKNYLGDKPENYVVSEEDVLKVVSHAKIDSIFDLTNAIGRKDRAGALTCLANLLENGESEIAAVALILRHIRILSTLKEGQSQGLSTGKLSAKAGVPQFFLRQYQEQCRYWEDSKINQTIEALHKTDKALKSSPVSSHIWLENLIVRSCSV